MPTQWTHTHFNLWLLSPLYSIQITPACFFVLMGQNILVLYQNKVLSVKLSFYCGYERHVFLDVLRRTQLRWSKEPGPWNWCTRLKGGAHGKWASNRHEISTRSTSCAHSDFTWVYSPSPPAVCIWAYSRGSNVGIFILLRLWKFSVNSVLLGSALSNPQFWLIISDVCTKF